MKILKLYRPQEAFNRHCTYEIYLNGEKISDLSNGEEQSIDLSAYNTRPQSLQAKMMWCGSKHKELATFNGEEVTLKVSGNEFLNRKLPLLGAFFPITGAITLNSIWPEFKALEIGILIVLIIGLIATLTIWRNSWLSLDIVSSQP